ncbi:unnamed protein product, partial [marine sediment metagenome]
MSVLRRLIVALTLALCLVPISQTPVAALSASDYFNISYSVTFSNSDIQIDEVVYATITGTATCIQDLSLSASEAVIKGRVIAEHTGSGDRVTLGLDYTLSINPFPNTAGEVVQASQTVALQFPDGSQPGSYAILGELIEARIKAVLWFNITSYLPPYQDMGLVTYAVSPPPPPPGTTRLAGSIDWQGKIVQTVTALSQDTMCQLTLSEGTMALDKNGYPLREISIVDIAEPPVLPQNRTIIGPSYDIGPDGATFEPAAALAISYEEEQIPEGVDEKNLVIAAWDEASWEWFELNDRRANSGL